MRLLSRNAEALFWLARYLERAASLARVIEMQCSFGALDPENGWSWLLALHQDEERFKERFEMSSRNIMTFYVTDTANVGSIRSSINWARDNARALRPFIPTEMWVQINTFHTAVEAVCSTEIAMEQLPRTCAEVRSGCLAQIGIAESTLFRDEGYQFFKLGLLVERADQTSRLLDVKFAVDASAAPSVDPSNEFVFWSTILRTAAAYQVFHRLEPNGADRERVARFLIFNPSHPRSIGFCVREMSEALNILRHSFRLGKVRQCMERCEVMMDSLQTAARDPQLADHLHEFNDTVQQSLFSITEAIQTAFFARIAPTAIPAPSASAESDLPAQTQSQTSSQTQSKSQSQSQPGS